MDNYLISVVGTTAIGKTNLSILLANYFKAEIISSDSRQFYKEMCIGTAVPSEYELSQVKHHFIQNRSIFQDYSVGDFERDAHQTARKGLYYSQQFSFWCQYLIRKEKRRIPSTLHRLSIFECHYYQRSYSITEY